jgi:ABC-type polysaccharide/polyol phosphate export permease
MRIIYFFPENNRLERIWKLAQVDFRRRYYHDRLGILWALIKPLFEVAIYYVVFTSVFKVEQENYGLFIFGGIIIWSGFSEASKRGMGLLGEKLYLIENIQLNKIDLYFSYLLSVQMAMSFNLMIFIGITILTGSFAGLNIFWLPVILANFFLICLGIIMILSCVQPFIKDLIHLWDMGLLLGMWVSGIFYPYHSIIEKIPALFYLNPFIGIIHNIRGSLLIGNEIDLELLGINLTFGILLYSVGLLVVNRFSRLAIEKL